MRSQSARSTNSEDRVAQVRAAQIGVHQSCIGEVGAGQVRTPQVRAGEIDPGEIGAGQVDAVEVPAAQHERAGLCAQPRSCARRPRHDGRRTLVSVVRDGESGSDPSLDRRRLSERRPATTATSPSGMRTRVIPNMAPALATSMSTPFRLQRGLGVTGRTRTPLGETGGVPATRPRRGFAAVLHGDDREADEDHGEPHHREHGDLGHDAGRHVVHDQRLRRRCRTRRMIDASVAADGDRQREQHGDHGEQGPRPAPGSVALG